MRRHTAQGKSNNFNNRNQRNDDFKGRNQEFRPRGSFKAVCSDCNADCDLPFKPVDGRPVYCRTCFPKHKKQF